jgi:DNA mismatch repair protein MSH2
MGSRPELEVEDEVGLLKAIRQLDSSRTAADTIRVFDNGDYLSAYGDDATFIAQAQYKTASVLKQLGRSPEMPYVTMTVTVFRSFLRDAIFRLSKFEVPRVCRTWDAD